VKALAITTVLASIFITPAYGWVNSNSCGNFSNNTCYYTASKAVEYARGHYGNKTNTPFPYYVNANCTNFVNQAIAAGLIGSNKRSTVSAKIPYYTADYNPNWDDSQQWYFLANDANWISTTWTGADWFFAYVQNQITLGSWYTGLHFQYVTQDSFTTALNFSQIQVGDIIFADWGYNGMTVDGVIDHVMIVTEKTGNSYAGIKVTYQSGGGDMYYRDQPLNNLGNLGNIPQVNSLFYVYRPTYYKQ